MVEALQAFAMLLVNVFILVYARQIRRAIALPGVTWRRRKPASRLEPHDRYRPRRVM